MAAQKDNRVGEERLNNQGCLMKIVEYISSNNIIVEFQDDYKMKVRATYGNFLNGEIKNLYYPYVFGVGMIGSKYFSRINGIKTKEYKTWIAMLNRCTNKKFKEKEPTYQNAICCKEWLLFENFYEWLHNQENFNKWYSGELWALDKDILIKRNKIYSPDTCCLVPKNINNLFLKCDSARGDLPIGVCEKEGKFMSYCKNPFTDKKDYLGCYKTIQEAFNVYKQYKEKLIKQVAEIEYMRSNITKSCYEAMINYKVEITD